MRVMQLKGVGIFRHKPLAAWVLAATLSTCVVTAVAVQDPNGTPIGVECDAFRTAATNAMQNHLTIVNTFMGNAQNAMQGAVSPSNSCIGKLAFLDFDLSKLIPDFGLLGTLLDTAINRLVTGVINKVCNAVVGVISSGSDAWNGVINTLNGDLNLNNQVQTWANGINYNLPSSGPSTSSNPVSYPTTLVDAPGKSCVDTLSGQVCTDGTTTPSTTDWAASVPSGAELAGTASSLNARCAEEQAVAAAIASENHTQIVRPQVCNEADSFAAANAAGLAAIGVNLGSGWESALKPINTPTTTPAPIIQPGSAEVVVGGARKSPSVSLPVRN